MIDSTRQTPTYHLTGNVEFRDFCGIRQWTGPCNRHILVRRAVIDVASLPATGWKGCEMSLNYLAISSQRRQRPTRRLRNARWATSVNSPCGFVPRLAALSPPWPLRQQHPTLWSPHSGWTGKSDVSSVDALRAAVSPHLRNACRERGSESI